MKRILIIGAGVALLAGTGAAFAQMPGGPDGNGPHGPMGGPMRWEMMHHMHHEQEQGAKFRFRKGDAEVDIACPSTEPLQACVAAADALLDKLNSTQPKPAQ